MSKPTAAEVDEIERRLEKAGRVAPDGARLLDEVLEELKRYVIFPAAEAAEAVTLFVAASHAQPAWEHATRLVVKSPLRRCGKTRLQEVLADLCHRPLRTANISSAALVRAIDEDDPPVLVLDEADSVFSKRKGERCEGGEDLRGIINAGHSRGWPYVRWDAKARCSEECATFAMAVVGGIGDFPDTIEDRAVVLKMRRRAPGEHVTQFRRRRATPPLHELRDRLHVWARDCADDLSKAEPDLPVEDRAADTWEPLVVIADAAGGSWPARARRACEVFSDEGDPDEATLGERLLSDLRAVFGDSERLASATILDRLIGLDESPWGDYFGHELRARDLARLLRPYGVRSGNVRLGAIVSKGYERASLMDPWRRYLGATAPQALQGLHGSEIPGQPRSGNVADEASPIRYTPEQAKQGLVADVAHVADERLEGATIAGDSDTDQPLSVDEIAAAFDAEVVAEFPADLPNAGICAFCHEPSVNLEDLGDLGRACEDCAPVWRPEYEALLRLTGRRESGAS